MGHRLEESQALSADGNEIPGAVVVVDEKANNGHYDKLTALTDFPFLGCNGSCPAVRVELGGEIRSAEVDDARKYWMVYSTAVAAFSRDVTRTRRKLPGK
jgi:hypothetical protein